VVIQDGQWIQVENLDEILKPFRPQLFHPQDPRYIPNWRSLRKLMIEGTWVRQFEGWRYVPGVVGFYGVFFRYEEWDQINKIRRVGTPMIRDLEWHRAYYGMEQDGFSGWSDDDEITSDYNVFEVDLHKIKLSDTASQDLFRKNGQFKDFISPRDNLFMIHDRPKGLPLYHNEAKNHLELGTRSGGKSFYHAGDMLHHLCFDGLKYYTPDGDNVKNPMAVIEVSAGQAGKSSEMLDKVEFAMEALADPENRDLGVWGDPEDEDFEPCPFWKRMTGDIGPNNKKNPWRNKFDVKMGNRWKKAGTGSRIYHTVHSANQKEGAQKSAGGRRTKLKKEEIGLNPKLIEAWISDEGLLVDNGRKMSSQTGIGTSGNMETVGPARKVFEHPEDYNCLSFTYPEHPDSKFCWFIPVYMVDMKFKDKNGNTDIQAAKAFYEKIYDDKSKASDPNVLLQFRMNFPIKIEDMWISGTGSILPVKEAETREKELVKGNYYQSNGVHIDLYWDSDSPRGVNYKVLTNAEPFYEWPLSSDRKSLEAVFTMYISPDKLKVGGQIPQDAVFALHDPYVSDEWDKGGSLGVTYFVVNPRYIPNGLPGNCIAASLIGKPQYGLDVYNETLEKGMAFYGNPLQGLWYEANRGDRVRSHFIRKKKLSLLCLQPQYEQGQFIFERNATRTGFQVGNKLAKISLLDAFRDWLLEPVTLNTEEGPETKMVIERIPCIFLLRQIKSYAIDRNYDAVSAMLPVSLAIGEQEHMLLRRNHQEHNPLGILTRHIKRKIYR
jgi:hypothetical protein